MPGLHRKDQINLISVREGNMDRALIIRQPWIDKILSGEKTWEMRSASTNVRGRIGLIEQGTGLIVGEAALVGVGEKVDVYNQPFTFDKHHIHDLDLLKKWPVPWVLESVKRYDEPVPYDHPKGAVIWVKL